MASSLDHIEQTLADAYRKEIDQKENVWRSLPFFAATLALELGAISQIAGHLPPAGTGPWRVSLGCIAVAGLATCTALGSKGPEQAGKTYPNGGRPEPPMEVVTKGWWTLREELVPREVLEAEHREADRKRAARRSLKSLIFGRG